MIKIFTHNDLDGIGCGILGKLAFKNVDIEYCDYNNIDEKVENFIDNAEFVNYRHIFITDISISEKLADKITNLETHELKDGSQLAEHFSLIDHHPTATNLNKYYWCTVLVTGEEGKCSGTSLFYKYIDDDELQKDNIIEFVETVRRYDTWEWNTIYNDDVPKKWNDLMYIYGVKKFTDKIVDMLSETDKFEFDKTDLLLLELEENRKNKYFENKEKNLIVKDIREYTVGIVFAEQYVSELGNYLAKKYNNLDFIILIGEKTISYRGVKENIDLGIFAKQQGGGGHPKASGSQIPLEKQIKYIEDLFSH